MAGVLAMGSVVGSRSAEANPTGAPTIPPESVQPARSAEQCADSLPVKFLAGQVLMVGIQARAMSSQAAIFKRYHVGGAVLMNAPSNPYDGSIKRFKKAAGSRGDKVLISTDEEGGEVQRFSSLGVLPSAEQIAHTLSPAKAQKLITQHGTKLKAVGVDMVLGPLADVAPRQGSGPLGSRVFSSNPNVVSTYDQAYVSGWERAGLLPTLKHFPGLGSASGNTDYQAATTPPLRSLKLRDFTPYKRLATSGTAVMVGNQNVPGWFKGPASLSRVVDRYLRQRLGYGNSLVVTDALNAAAITQEDAEARAVVDAIAAGNNMALIVEPSTDPTSSAGLIRHLEAGLEKAVGSGTISKQQLAESVLGKMTAQHIEPCSLA
jgi:beta-N-acetylhexosaminidase